jgi:urease accessory protein
MICTDQAAAVLSLTFSRQAGVRPMQVLRQDPPWRVVRMFQSKENECLVHLHNLSGGILSGDRLTLLVEVGEEARVQLTSTGATRIYRHRKGRDSAYTFTRARVQKNAIFEYLPDQLIPYAESQFFQETEIELSSEGAGLFWWETLTPGRTAYGEKFVYGSLRIASVISCDEKPIAIEQFLLEPALRSPQQPGILGNFECCSTFYICRTGVGDQQWIELQTILEDEAELLSCTEMQWGTSRLVKHGIVVRGVGMQASRLFAALLRFWTIAKHYLYGSHAVLPRKVY